MPKARLTTAGRDGNNTACQAPLILLRRIAWHQSLNTEGVRSCKARQQRSNARQERGPVRALAGTVGT